MTNPKLFNDLEKIESLNNYDLTEVSENDAPEPESFFKEPEEAATEKKEKRGRPKKQPAPQPVTKIFGSDETSAPTFLEQEENEQFVNSDGGMFEDTKVSLNTLLPADTLLTVVDKFMSVVLPMALNALTNSKLKPSDFKLTADEKKSLKPSIEAAAKTIPINFSNPWIALGITIVAVYGSKTVDRINFDSIDADDIGPKVERRGRPKKN